MTITFEEIRNSERYGDCNEVNYDLIFEDIQKGILKKYKRKSPEKFSKCVCSHSKSDHKRKGQGECEWFNCKCKQYRIEQQINKEAGK